MFFYEPRYIGVPVLTDLQDLIYISSVWTQRCSLKELPESMDNGDGWRERIMEIWVDSATL